MTDALMLFAAFAALILAQPTSELIERGMNRVDRLILRAMDKYYERRPAIISSELRDLLEKDC